MTPGEVAQLFRVDPKTVTRWGNTGKLRSIRTPGGHRRFLAEDVDKLLDVVDAPPRPALVAKCWKCLGTTGEVIDRGTPYGRHRFMHAFGKCPE